MIHILSSTGCKKIPSLKEQTEHKPVLTFSPEHVYISATDNKGMPLDNLLPDGSEVKVGTVLGIRKDFGIPVHSPVSGKIVGIVKKTNSLLGRPANFIDIANDKKDEKIIFKPISEHPTQEEIVNKMKEGGIVGLGGAGFPSFIKFNIKPEMKIDTLLINACECEPYLTTDYTVGLSFDMKDFFKAIKVILDALNIPSCIFVTKDEKVALIKKTQDEIDKFGDKRITLHAVKSVYPAGYERTIVRMVLKREYNKLPSEAHAIISNLQTMMAIGEFFFKGETVSKKVFTVSGCVKNPANVSAPYGTLIKDMINFVGGYTIEKGTLLAGGPMTAEHLGSDDVPLLLPNDAITVMEEKKFNLEPCLRCGRCTAHCPVNIQPVEINNAAARGDFKTCYELGVMDCVSCGLCTYVCPSHIDVSAAVKQAKLLTTLKVVKNLKK